MEKRDNTWWNKLKYKDSLDYYLASLLKKYKLDPLKAVVWFYNKNKNIMIFQYEYHYYLLEDNEIREIRESDVWHQKK